MHYAAWQPVSSPRRKKALLLAALPQDYSLEPLADPGLAEAGIAARPPRQSRRARPPMSRNFLRSRLAPADTTPRCQPAESGQQQPLPSVQLCSSWRKLYFRWSSSHQRAAPRQMWELSPQEHCPRPQRLEALLRVLEVPASLRRPGPFPFRRAPAWKWERRRCAPGVRARLESLHFLLHRERGPGE